MGCDTSGYLSLECFLQELSTFARRELLPFYIELHLAFDNSFNSVLCLSCQFVPGVVYGYDDSLISWCVVMLFSMVHVVAIRR